MCRSTFSFGLLVLAIFVSAGQSATFVLRTVALENDPLPDGTGFYEDFAGTPIMGENGEVLFRIRINDNVLGHEYALVSGPPDNQVIVARTQQVFLAPNVRCNSISGHPGINAAGTVLFRCSLSGTGVVNSNDSGTLIFNGTPPVAFFAREGDPVCGRTLGSLASGSDDSETPFNDANQTAVAEYYDDASGGGVGVFRLGATGDVCIAAVDDIGPGGLPILGVSEPSLNNLGEVAFMAFQGSSTGPMSILVGDGIGTRTVVATGTTLPGADELDRSRDDRVTINDAGQVAFTAETDDNTDGVWRGDNPGLTLITREGLGVSNVPGVYVKSILRSVALNQHGQVTFKATIGTPTTGEDALCLGDGGSLARVIVYTGQDAPGVGEISRIYDYALNDAGQVAFRAGIDLVPDVVPADEVALMIWDPGTGLHEIARTGTALPGMSAALDSIGFCGTEAFSHVHPEQDGLNDAGEVAFQFELRETAERVGVAVWSLIRCPGDITGDQVCNVLDFNALASHFGQSVPPNTNGDLTGDGLVNIADFNILAGDFGCGAE